MRVDLCCGDGRALWLNKSMVRSLFAGIALVGATCAAPPAAAAQTPAPFPRPGQTRPAEPPPSQPAPVATPAPGQPPATVTDPGQPPDLGVPLYPGAQFIASYDAGRGQRYYLYGVQSDFLQIVGFYKTALKQKGELVFDEPPVHMFEIGRYREETMAFTPSVTVKDYTWAGSAGYINPKRGATPARFKTVIQIVPNLPAVAK
jgi:hypothetical protein